MTLFRKAPTLDVIGVFLERSDPFLLQPVIFLEKIPISLGMAGNPFIVVSEDIIREKELRVATIARTQGHQEQRSMLGEVGGKFVRNQFKFGRVSARIFQALHLHIKLPGLVSSLADRSN